MEALSRCRLPAEKQTALNVEIATAEMSKEQSKSAQPVEIVIGVGSGGASSEVRLKVLLKTSALAQ